MPTVQEIINYVDRKYPNTVTTANKVIDLDSIHKKIFMELNKLSNNYTSANVLTVADQKVYALPNLCRHPNIVRIDTSNTDTVSDSTIWAVHNYKGLNDEKTGGYTYGYISPTEFSIEYNGYPLKEDDLVIRVFFYPYPVALTSDVTGLAATPQLDSDYHDLLKFALISEIASEGQYPDADIADYWQARYDEFMKNVKESLYSDSTMFPVSNLQIKEEW
jgi:hypothetical protein